MKYSLHGFVYVASAQDNPGISAFHVDVLEKAESFEEAGTMGSIERVRQFNVAAALANGITLEQIGAEINATLAAELEAARSLAAGEQARVAAAVEVALEAASAGESLRVAAAVAAAVEAFKAATIQPDLTGPN